MALFSVTAKTTRQSNGVRLEKGMSVEVVTQSSTIILSSSGKKQIEEAFMRKYGIDINKVGGVSTSNFEVKKVN